MVTELFESIHQHDSARVKQLITKHPQLINAYGDAGQGSGTQETSLIRAARLGQADTVQFLLEHGANVSQKTTGCCEFDALHITIMQECPSPEVVKLLLDAGADINGTNECLHATPLSQAAHSGHADIAKLLVERGAEVDKQDDGAEHETALMKAAKAGHIEIIRLLLKHNADQSLTDINNETALAKAMKNGHESIALLLEDALRTISRSARPE